MFLSLVNIHHSLPNENLRGGYGVREACGSENLMLRAFLARFGKTNARAPTVAGLVCPRQYTICLYAFTLKISYVTHKIMLLEKCLAPY